MHVVITGASAGIGRALAREYAKNGAELSLVARRMPLLEELAQEIGGSPHLVSQDLSDSARASDFLPAAVQAHGPIDVLINNAGTQIISPFVDQDFDNVELMLQLNLHTPLRLIHAVLPDMVERRRGTIINVCSAAAYAVLPGQSAYAATKAGLGALSEALRAEQRFSGVHVLTVYPGYISTELGDDGYELYDVPTWARFYRPGDATVLARKTRRAAEKKKERVIYPATNAVPMFFQSSTRFLIERLAPPLKRDA